MLIIEFADSPLAVHYHAAASQPRLIAIGDKPSPFSSALDDLFWSNYEPRSVDWWIAGDNISPAGPTRPNPFPELRVLHTIAASQFVLELRQNWLDFLFTTTATPDELWRVWATCETPQVVAISSLEISAYGGSIPPGGVHLLEPEPTDILELTPPRPYLPVLATDAISLSRWQLQPLPFRVRMDELPASESSEQ